jgi:hypothetical protein
MVISCVGWAAACAAAATGPGEFKAGFAERDSSPEIGPERLGGYGQTFHRRFRDPCKVKVAVFGKGMTNVALVRVDALALSRKVILATRSEIRRLAGISEQAYGEVPPQTN